MKTRWLVLVMVAALAVAGGAQAQKKATGQGPVIEIKETTHDFGTIFKTDEKFRHDFIVRNVGNADLMIEEVKPG